MLQVAGITFENNSYGVPVYAKIDLRKFGESLSSFFKQQGISLESIKVPNKATNKAIEDAVNSKNLKSFYNVEDLLADLYN